MVFLWLFIIWGGIREAQLILNLHPEKNIAVKREKLCAFMTLLFFVMGLYI